MIWWYLESQCKQYQDNLSLREQLYPYSYPLRDVVHTASTFIFCSSPSEIKLPLHPFFPHYTNLHSTGVQMWLASWYWNSPDFLFQSADRSRLETTGFAPRILKTVSSALKPTSTSVSLVQTHVIQLVSTRASSSSVLLRISRTNNLWKRTCYHWLGTSWSLFFFFALLLIIFDRACSISNTSRIPLTGL